MKKLIAGLGMTFAAVAPAHAHGWSGSMEDMRTMEANQQGPAVRLKSVQISGNGWHGGRYHTNPASYQCHDGVCQDGWRVLETSASGRRPVGGGHRTGLCALPSRSGPMVRFVPIYVSRPSRPVAHHGSACGLHHASHHAGGWQRSAGVVPHGMRRPVRAVARHVAQHAPQHHHFCPSYSVIAHVVPHAQPHPAHAVVRYVAPPVQPRPVRAVVRHVAPHVQPVRQPVYVPQVLSAPVHPTCPLCACTSCH